MSNTVSIAKQVTPPTGDVVITTDSGVATFPGGVGNIIGDGNFTVTGAGDTVMIQENQAQVATNYTDISAADSPYSLLATDYYVSVDTSAGPVTINLPNTQSTLRVIVIKDRTGNANSNPISITTPGGVVTIDGQTTYDLNQMYEAVDILYNLTSYEIY